jgi:DNA polymerase-3 subunit gamma/tau
MVHKDRIFELSDAVIGGDPKRVAVKLDDLINSGKDPVFIAGSLIWHYRDLMILKTAGEPTSDMAFAEDELEKMNTQAGKLSLEEILYILQNLTHCMGLMKGAMFTRAPLEIALIRLAKRADTMAIPDILDKLDLAKKGLSGTLSAAGAAGGMDPVSSVKMPSRPQVQRYERTEEKRARPEKSQDEDNNGSSEGNDIHSHWKAVLNYVRSKKMSVYTFLNAARPVEMNANKVIIGFGQEHAFNKEALETESNKFIIEEAVKKITGASPRVEFTLLDFLSEPAAQNRGAEEKKSKAKEKMNPLIEQAMDVFGGHIVRDLMEEGR